MRIAYVGTAEPSLSGGMISILLTVDALRQAGHDAAVIATRPAPAWSPVEIPWTEAADPFAELAGVDAAITGWAGVERAVESGAPVVGHHCAGYEPHLWPRLRARISAIYALPTLKLVIAPHLKRTISADQGADAHFVGTALVSSWFQPKPRRTAGRIRVLAVGADPGGPYAPVPFKGISTVIEICRRLRARGHDFELVRIAPRGDEWIASPEVDEAHVGLRPREAADVYRSCDVFLSASTAAEGLGKPAIEAALSGLACVLPAIPSYADIPELERAALMYPPGDTEAAVEHTATLLADSGKRVALARDGAALDLDHLFSPAAVAGRVAAALRSFAPGVRYRGSPDTEASRRSAGQP